jgi:hypothetical protein
MSLALRKQIMETLDYILDQSDKDECEEEVNFLISDDNKPHRPTVSNPNQMKTWAED